MRFKWDKKYLYWGVTAFCVIACSAVFILALSNWSVIDSVWRKAISILSPIIIGFVIAWLLTPILSFFERSVFWPLAAKLKLKPHTAKIAGRIVSLVITVLIATALLIGLLVLVLPQLYNSIEKLILSMPRYFEVGSNWLEDLFYESEYEETLLNVLSSITNYFTNWLDTGVLPMVDTILESLSSGVIAFAKGLLQLIVGAILSVYIMYNRETMAAQAKRMLYALFKVKTVNSIIKNSKYVHKAFSGFLVGKIVASIIVGLLCAVFMLIFKMPYVVLISFIIGLTNIIPFVGPYIGTIPSAFLILLESPVKCLIFVLFIIVLQTFDGNVLSAKILGSTTGLTGFWVIFAITVGGGLFGFIGMLCGVPVFAVLYTAIRTVTSGRLDKKGMPSDTGAYLDLDTVDPDTKKMIYK